MRCLRVHSDHFLDTGLKLTWLVFAATANRASLMLPLSGFFQTPPSLRAGRGILLGCEVLVLAALSVAAAPRVLREPCAET
mmetsp:Transcript_22319/g.36960  ORF Transcript_22319/g.36960 Transcript_22319/m.36960 type:complete len:81 (+) Transcript_22319:18-260(+)